MNIKEAIKFLKGQGYIIYDNGTKEEWAANSIIYFNKKLHYKKRDKYYKVWSGNNCNIYNTRQLINFAYAIKKDHSKVSHLVKENKGKNRTALRDLIKKEEFDKIPNNTNIKEDDRWNYD